MWLARSRSGGEPSQFDALSRLLLEEDFAVGMILHQLKESDVEEIMRLPWQMFCSDAVLIGRPHPRTYGTFPRVLGDTCGKGEC